MTPNPVVLPGTASVHEAARAMRDAQIGDVIRGYLDLRLPGLRCRGTQGLTTLTP
jgi:CBS domain-containing protein